MRIGQRGIEATVRTSSAQSRASSGRSRTYSKTDSDGTPAENLDEDPVDAFRAGSSPSERNPFSSPGSGRKLRSSSDDFGAVDDGDDDSSVASPSKKQEAKEDEEMYLAHRIPSNIRQKLIMLELLGAGASAQVYKAFYLGPPFRLVAVKVRSLPFSLQKELHPPPSPFLPLLTETSHPRHWEAEAVCTGVEDHLWQLC